MYHQSESTRKRVSVAAPAGLERNSLRQRKAAFAPPVSERSGNRFDSTGSSGLPSGLTVSQRGDRDEQEASRIAEQVMCSPGGGAGSPGPAPLSLQGRSGSRSAASVALPFGSETASTPGRPLDSATRSFFEPRFGHDFGRVRVFTGAEAAASADSLNAHAYTIGQDLVFGAGAYAPGTASGDRLLAHELTHVLQQNSTAGMETAENRAGREVSPNTARTAAGRQIMRVSSVPAGLIQREEKPKLTTSGERTGTKDAKDKFTFKAELTVPLLSDFKLGKVSFLDDLKLTGSGGVTGAPLGVSVTELDDFKLQMAMTLAKLELESVKDKTEALRKGKLSFGATLGTTGGPTFSFDPFKPKLSLGSSLAVKGSATTPSLIPSPYGTLTFGAGLSAGGSLSQTFGSDGKFTPKAESKATLTGSYESASSRNPALTLGGLLGDKARVTAGIEGSASGSMTPDTTRGALGAGGSLGLTGTGKKGVERFIKIQVNGNVGLDHKAGSAATSTQSIFLGASTGFKF